MNCSETHEAVVKFRIAFLGIDHPHGAGWRQSMDLLRDEIELVAIVPRFGGSLASLEERSAELPRFETVAELVAWGHFDGAVVCLTNAESPSAIIQLAEAGKAILAEKPAAAGLDDFAAAASAVERTGVAFRSGYLWRYDAAAERLRDMVSDGRFGRLISIEMIWVTSNVRRRDPQHYLFDPALSGGGFFNWLGCHWLNLLPYVTGMRVTAVTARLGNFGETPTSLDDGGAAILELGDRTLATFTGGYWLPRWTGESRWTLRGADRWVHWDAQRPGTGGVLEIHGPQPHFQPMDEVFTIPADATPGYGGQRTVRLLRDWLAAARGEPADSRCDLMSTCETLRLLDAIQTASTTGRRLNLS